MDETIVTVHRIERKPGWLKESAYIDTSHELTIAIRKSRLIAICAVGPVRDALQKWLDKPPLPHLRRIPAAVLEDALLRGESKSLWLRGTHPRRNTKADSKAIVGPDLRAALTPFDDTTFAMSSARSTLSDTPMRTAFKGTVGTTPQSSLIWNRQTESTDEFFQCIREPLVVIEDALDNPSGENTSFPLLAQQVYDLSGVSGAYEISCANPTEMPAGLSESDEKWEAAELLQSAVLNVTGHANSPDIDISIGLNGSISGNVRARVRVESGRVHMRFGFVGTPTDPVTATKVMNALEYNDLLTVYYASGHAINGNSIFRPRIMPTPFPNWSFQSFAGFDIEREKPSDANSQGIHDAIGRSGDTSLFSWVVQHFSEGWLTCDDGPGEIADFVHVAHDGTLSLIHVKGAHSKSLTRGVATTAFEVVSSQAAKNITFLEPETLMERLQISPILRPASWFDGNRIEGRADIIEAIGLRDARNQRRIVVVQPHLSKLSYDRLYAQIQAGATPSAELLRLHRVENLLNSHRLSVTGASADLTVIGSMV